MADDPRREPTDLEGPPTKRGAELGQILEAVREQGAALQENVGALRPLLETLEQAANEFVAFKRAVGPRLESLATSYDRLSRDAATKASVAELSEQIGKLARDVTTAAVATKGETGRLRVAALWTDERVSELERRVGQWPTGPDDPGTGLAGRIARDSQADITGANRAVVVSVEKSRSIEPGVERALAPLFGKLWAKRIGIVIAIVWAIVASYFAVKGHG